MNNKIIRSKPVINIQGYLSGVNGWSRHAIEFSTALNPYALLTTQDWGSVNGRRPVSEWIRKYISRSIFLKKPSYGIGIGPIERMNEIVGDFKVASVVWETTIIPPSKLKYLENKDQIWTPSKWGKDLLIRNGIPEGMVKIVPEGVNVDRFRPLTNKQKPIDSTFRFLCIGKWEVRKGIKDLIDVYCTTFTKEDPVELLLHSHNPYIPDYSNKEIERYIERRYPSHPEIVLINSVSDEALVKLYNMANIFILPTKAEGWGLPIIEAMACGLPAIVTNYSGHTDYISLDTSYMIDVKEMVGVSDPIFFGDAEEYGEWAQPNLEHLGEIMRYVASHADEVQDKGMCARSDVADNWTWDNAAKKGMDALGI